MSKIKKRVLVDMDGVLANIYQQAINFEYADSGRLITIEEVTGKQDEVVAFPNGKKHINTRGFFKTAPVMENAVEVMRKLVGVYDVYIVSAAMEFPKSLEEKHEWLAEHFPFISWKNIIFCGSKVPIQGDILIDDHYKNLDPFPNRTLLFTQPHNVNDSKHHERVANWKEVEKLLIG